jgi:hypothetical protein
LRETTLTHFDSPLLKDIPLALRRASTFAKVASADKPADRMTGWGMDADSSIHGLFLLILSKFIIFTLRRHYGTNGENSASHGERFFYSTKPL